MRDLKSLVAEDVAESGAIAQAAEVDAPLTRNARPKRQRPDRIGQRLIAAHFDNETFKTFKILCAEEGATTQSAVSEAIELLFKKYHKPVTPDLKAQARNRS